jgi:shikimate kinase
MGNQLLIGLSGTNGSGKDSVGHILARDYGCMFISVTELLRKEAENRGWSVDRKSLRTISTEWRKEFGLGVLIDKGVEAFEPHKNDFRGLSIASLRNPGEADRIHALGGTVLWLDADPHIRYERIQKNAATRDRAEEDNRTFEQFLDDERAEMYAPAGSDDTALNMHEVKERCDIIIDNDSNDLVSFGNRIATALHLL